MSDHRVLHPGARIAEALIHFENEAMRAVADAALQMDDYSRASMKKMVAEERATLKLSLQEVAERAGITKSHMWEIEHGRSVNPTVWTVYGLSKALGIPFVVMAAGALNDTEDKSAQPGDALPVDEKCSLSTSSLHQSLTSVSKNRT